MDVVAVWAYFLDVILLVSGVVFLLWPKRVQEFALRISSQKFNPFYARMQGDSYVRSLRTLGFIWVIAAGAVLFVLILSDLGVLKPAQ
jgi:hypothetical protein